MTFQTCLKTKAISNKLKLLQNRQFTLCNFITVYMLMPIRIDKASQQIQSLLFTRDQITQRHMLII